ncbi:MAG: hypothetical protein IPG75_14895 [Gemmatimonadetes bacterium]|nr:hypothetical protein [Gemmatimonadota bacterium]
MVLIVGPGHRAVERLDAHGHHADHIEREIGIVELSGALEPLVIGLDALFRPVE